MPLKIDLHVHTHYSFDSVIAPEELILYGKKRGLDGIAVTDHDRIDGALKIAEETDFFIIPGVEISSLNGHILALNIQNHIPSRLSAEETVNKIHAEGGLAIACHPVTLFKGSLGKSMCANFDAVEVINASAIPFSYSVKQAQKLATRLGIAQVAGTDAHYGPEIGHAYTLVNAELEVDEVLRAIKTGLCQPFGRAIPWTLRLRKEFLILKKRSKLILEKRKARGTHC